MAAIFISCCHFGIGLLWFEGGRTWFFPGRQTKKEKPVWFLVPLGHSGSKIICTVQASTLISFVWYTGLLCMYMCGIFGNDNWIAALNSYVSPFGVE